MIEARTRWVSGSRRLFATAAALSTFSLGSAALNRIETAGWFLRVSVAALLVAGLHWCYQRLPADGRAALLSRRFLKNSAIVSLVAATLFSTFYWFVGWMPLDLDLPLGVHAAIARLDFIPSLFSVLLPSGWRSGLHQYFRGGITYCFPGPFWWETMRWMRAAIPGYYLTFMAASFGFRIVTFALTRRRGD